MSFRRKKRASAVYLTKWLILNFASNSGLKSNMNYKENTDDLSLIFSKRNITLDLIFKTWLLLLTALNNVNKLLMYYVPTM